MMSGCPQHFIRQKYDSTLWCGDRPTYIKMAGIAQSVQRLATGCRSWDRIPVEARFSAPVQTDRGTIQPSVHVQWLPGLFTRGKAAVAWR
jgi:hypothetical protein